MDDIEPFESSDRDKAKDWLVQHNPEEQEFYHGAGVTWFTFEEASGAAEIAENRTGTKLDTHAKKTKLATNSRRESRNSGEETCVKDT